MQSTDVEPTRLDEAKRRVAELIDQMESGDVAMIVSFSDSARVEQVFTDNRRELLRALESDPAHQPADRAGRSTARGGRPGQRRAAGGGRQASGRRICRPRCTSSATGRFADVENFRLGNLKPVYVPIGDVEPPNVGIMALSTRRQEDAREKLQAFGRLENFGQAKLKVEVDLYHDDALLDSAAVELEPRGSGGVVFDLGQMPPGVLKLRTGSGGGAGG